MENFIVHALMWYGVAGLASGMISTLSALTLFLPRSAIRRHLWNTFYGNHGFVMKAVWASAYYYVPLFTMLVLLSAVRNHEYTLPPLVFALPGYLQGFLQLPRMLLLSKEHIESQAQEEDGQADHGV